MLKEINARIGFELSLWMGGLLLSLLLTPIYTHYAYKYKLWKKQKSVAVTGEALTVMNKAHAAKIKRKFPTMAGVVTVLTVSAITYGFCLNRAETWLPLAAFVGGGLIGFVDDLINLSGRNKVAGLRAPVKFSLLAGLALGLGYFFAYRLGWTSIVVPFYGRFEIGAVVMMLLFAFAVISTGNAVNISDGMDGLAGGLSLFSYGAYAIIALLQEQWYLAGFCAIVMGALVTYIWFNVYPARFMMGDTGSFALGAGLGVVAMMSGSFLLLPVIGFLFVVEAGSSLIQIISKKFFHRKVFISAPIHHHLQAKGWEESKVVMRFWVISSIMALLGVFLAMEGGIL